jgi:putative SOS response-associated peptidase YedK
VPHLFTDSSGSPILAIAGLWDRWRHPETREELLSATMIVSGASEWMEGYDDRMPVLQTPDMIDPGLEARPERKFSHRWTRAR